MMNAEKNWVIILLILRIIFYYWDIKSNEIFERFTNFSRPGIRKLGHDWMCAQGIHKNRSNKRIFRRRPRIPDEPWTNKPNMSKGNWNRLRQFAFLCFGILFLILLYIIQDLKNQIQILQTEIWFLTIIISIDSWVKKNLEEIILTRCEISRHAY